jgi:hypothetical protein
MVQRHPFEITYRGQTYAGEWRVEDGQVHVTSRLGSVSAPVVTLMDRMIPLPSNRAKSMLWKLARANDPKRPFFYW